MRCLTFLAVVFGFLAVGIGCHGPEITAVPLSAWNRDEPCGIPFYLPKPLLIIAKNFRNIEEEKTGLTDSAPIPDGFDDQSKYADLNARTSFVEGAPVSGYQAVGPATGAGST